MLRTVSRVRGARRALTRTFATPSNGESSKPAASAPDSTTPKKWSRPVEPGVLPAYDEALAYIERDTAAKRAELTRLRSAKAESAWTAAQLEKLEVESEVNLPEVRWNFEQGLRTLLSIPIIRWFVSWTDITASLSKWTSRNLCTGTC